MINIDSYDLTNKDDVFKLGVDLGSEFGKDVLNPLSHAIGPELSVVFFLAVFSSPAGSMFASIGTEAASAVLGEIERASMAVGEQLHNEKH